MKILESNFKGLTECHHCRLEQFNTCGWNPNIEDSPFDAGTGIGGTGGTGGTVGAAMRNETLPVPATLPPTTIHNDPTQPDPVLVSTEYVNTNTTVLPATTGPDYVDDSWMCAAWYSMYDVPFGSDIAASYDYNVRFSCEITARNKNKCTARCINGGKIIGKNKFVMTCKCPRYVSLLSLRHFVLRSSFSINLSSEWRATMWMVLKNA